MDRLHPLHPPIPRSYTHTPDYTYTCVYFFLNVSLTPRWPQVDDRRNWVTHPIPNIKKLLGGPGSPEARDDEDAES